MIAFLQGNLFDADVEALVNTVNTVGVMGKGVALQFKEKFPGNFIQYSNACKRGEVRVGKMFVTETGRFQNPRFIVNFPTKEHWRGGSKLSFVSDGLDDLIVKIKHFNIKSIALPPLGCGNGGLDWQKVKPIIIEKLGSLGIAVQVFEPGLKIASEVDNHAKTSLTKARAMVLWMLESYGVLGFEATHLEVQKLAYLLQSFGQADLKLAYKKGIYGPYAQNLQHLLNKMDGVWLAGDVRVADGKPLDTLWVLPGKTEAIAAAIQQFCSSEERIRLEQVSAFIDGFQSPFGLELLATVHWVCHHEISKGAGFPAIVHAIHNWTPRKKMLMTKPLVENAHQRLHEFGLA